MTDDRDLRALERTAYHDSYSDGIIDIFVGASLVWIGVAWIWLSGIAGLAGILPAVFVVPMLEGRRRFLGSRGGYVKWGAPRRRWERRNLAALLIVGIALLLFGIGMFVFVSRSSTDGSAWEQLGPGLIAWLLALLAIGLGFLMGTWRMFAYAAVLAGGGIVTAVAEASPGWPLLAAGILITATGLAMLTVFVRRNPVIEAR